MMSYNWILANKTWVGRTDSCHIQTWPMKTSCKIVHVLFPSGGLSGNCRRKELKDEKELDSWITTWNTSPLSTHSGLWCTWKIYFYYFKPVRVWNSVYKSAYPNICNVICYELMWKSFDFILNLESNILVTEYLMAWC